jgi:HlyD family secretion protein
VLLNSISKITIDDNCWKLYSETTIMANVRSRIIKFLFVIVIIVAAVAGFLLWSRLKKETPEDKLVLYGNVDIRQVNLAFKVTERVRQMQVEEGDHVEKGQLLASLESEKLNAAVLSRAAQVRVQAQVVARMEAGSRPQEIERARAEYEAARVHAENAEVTNKRFQALKELDAESVQKSDDANATAMMADSLSRAAKQTLDLAIAGPRVEDINAAKATLEYYRAELEIAKRNLADANLYSPSPGIIQTRILEPGDMVSSQAPAYIIALTDPIWIRAYVGESDLGKVYEGMPAKVSTDSFPGKTYDGWVGFISPTAEFTPKSVETPEIRTSLVYQIRVYVRNPENQLRLGMPATVEIDLSNSLKQE